MSRLIRDKKHNEIIWNIEPGTMCLVNVGNNFWMPAVFTNRVGKRMFFRKYGSTPKTLFEYYAAEQVSNKDRWIVCPHYEYLPISKQNLHRVKAPFLSTPILRK